jgi:hypothetical protein
MVFLSVYSQMAVSEMSKAEMKISRSVASNTKGGRTLSTLP